MICSNFNLIYMKKSNYTTFMPQFEYIKLLCPQQLWCDNCERWWRKNG